MKKIIMKNFK